MKVAPLAAEEMITLMPGVTYDIDTGHMLKKMPKGQAYQGKSVHNSALFGHHPSSRLSSIPQSCLR